MKHVWPYQERLKRKKSYTHLMAILELKNNDTRKKNGIGKNEMETTKQWKKNKENIKLILSETIISEKNGKLINEAK